MKEDEVKTPFTLNHDSDGLAISITAMKLGDRIENQKFAASLFLELPDHYDSFKLKQELIQLVNRYRK